MKASVESKTIVFFVLALIVSVAGYFGFADFIPEEAFGEVGVAVISIVGIILRLLTSKKIVSVLP